MTKSPILDLACGSGIMLLPIFKSIKLNIFCLDYNENACLDTKLNQMTSLRGDAFCLPIKENSVAQIINCQFLNQQIKENASIFINEIARILQPGGQAIIVWRNSQSLLHRVSHFLLSLLDLLKKAPIFPQYRHSINELRQYSSTSGLIVSFEAVSLPISNYNYVSSGNMLANIIGASNILVLKKPQTTSPS